MRPSKPANAAQPWWLLVRRFLSLPRVRRLGLLGVVAIAFIVTAATLFRVHSDARFHNRIDTYVEPDPDAVGIIQPDEFPTSQGPSLIPPNIWQIFLEPPKLRKVKAVDPKKKASQEAWVAKWKKINPKHNYNLVNDDDMTKFVSEYVRDGSPLQKTLMGPGNPAMKSDLLRYLILYIEGGVYTDMDTIALQPVDKWIPQKYSKDTHVVIGIEFDRLNGKNWRGVHDDLQFCQWTIAAAPGHRLFTTMLTRSMKFLEELQQPSSFSSWAGRLSSADVLTTTGPSAWTDAVFQELHRMDPTIESLRDLSGLREERLIGDILILPIDGFGVGQRHSNSTRGKKPPPMSRVKHQFRGTWRDF